MRAVYLQVPESLLHERRRTGADRWDERWQGVLHLVPAPSAQHQRLEFLIEKWLDRYWTTRSNGRVYHGVNVARAGAADWRQDYRCPDLVLLEPERFGIDRDEYLEGGPDVVVEIRSPEDETYDKIPFYAGVGARELWVVDRDTRAVDVLDLGDHDARSRAAGADGWLCSSLGIELTCTADRRLGLRMDGDDRTIEWIP